MTVLCGAAAVLVLTGSGGVSSAVESGTASAEAFAIQVSVPGQGSSIGGAVSGPPDAVGVGGAFAFPADGSIAQAASISSSVSASGASSEAQVSVSGLSLFGGEVTVASVTVNANARATSRRASGGTAGSSVTGMTVAGAPVATGPESSVPLGDWGTATILQQSSSPYGSRKARGFNAGMTALQVHLNIDHAGLPAGTDVVVGYADVAAEALERQARVFDDTRRPIRPKVNSEPAKPRKSRRPTIPPVRSVPTDVIPRLTASGYVFPVYGQAGFTDSFNAPRATTGWHHGEDIFAPLGAPVLAVANGIVYSVGWNEVGGLRFWLQDLAGNEFYYAHLSAFSPLAINGAQVRAGDVIGFVGNTGDAEHTPYHLHFEIHPVSLLYRGYDGSAVPPLPVPDCVEAAHRPAVHRRVRLGAAALGLEPGAEARRDPAPVPRHLDRERPRAGLAQARDARGRPVGRRRRAGRSSPAGQGSTARA